jgi:cytochrome o ubiquinol oxidase subunit 1
VHYEDIWLPKNSAVGLYIAGFAFLVGFGAIWHIVWMAVIGFIGIAVSIIIRTQTDETEYCIPAATVEQMETANGKRAA